MRHFLLTLLLCFSLLGNGVLTNDISNERQVHNGFISKSFLLESAASDTSTKTSQHYNEVSEASEQLSVPPFRSAAGVFLHLKQLEPEYGLFAEFLPENWSVALYQKLIDTGELHLWYLPLSTTKRKHRLAAWKDSNLLYKTGLIQQDSLAS
jgi:hypothetical protein